MYGAWTVQRVKDAEARVMARVGDDVLMRRASYALAGHAAELLRELTGSVAGRRCVLLVGAGNNGGDALWAGAFLRRRGVAVTAILLNPRRAHPAGLAALRRAGGRVRTDAGSALQRADLVLDGIVGISASGGLREDAVALLQRVRCPVLAVDLPSGVEPDTGAARGEYVCAAVTVTFGARKPVHVLGTGAVASGDVRFVDIGIGDELGDPDLRLLERADVAALWPRPGPASDKYSQGVVGIAAGSSTYPGAAVLAASGAVLATSGMVRFAGSAADEVRSRWPEVVATGSVQDAGRVQAWVAGPGMGTGASARGTLRHILGAGVPVCADADAITMLAAHPELLDARDPDTPLVLTPHAGEFARLTGAEPGEDRVAAVRAAATRWRATILLKGHTTVVADEHGTVYVNPARSSAPATAGSGDVLAGVLGALLAAGIAPPQAAAAAAWMHSYAAELSADGAPTSASRIAAALPDAIRKNHDSY